MCLRRSACGNRSRLPCGSFLRAMSSHPTLSVEGKVALVTGGSRGIGAATVRLFVLAGARVVFNYKSAQSEAQRLVEECGAENCHAVQADLTGTAFLDQTLCFR